MKIFEKSIDTYTEDDMTIIRCKKQRYEVFDELYAIENLDNLKIYITREDG